MQATERLESGAHEGTGSARGDLNYWVVAAFLAVVTLVEVSTYTHPAFWEDVPGLGNIMVPTLLFLMAVKFWTVTFFFMHLRSDKPFVTLVFYSGLVLAVAVYIVTMLASEFFVGVEGSSATRMLARTGFFGALTVVVLLVAHFGFVRRDRRAVAH
ncbi:MAG: hypothetical protein KatS3mg008_1500 [Acidimicrobiales bacterium]|nr:MAG: hypothetical protein KatS3mg008_1500 [Acidimicrobiales bacterium]